ncbi:lipid-A-disaccharide synthase [Acidocella aminolytica]|uniref:Lipid-A-disaccharide synthase n=1 Tax=Acidocella aminolytica 101 = DSM 11237 TaxID=1120923 RepID=A0A0D6PJ69_9PROT|nr:lipid-A-disaccharide synthase [Acidocella aminolytica]GAN81712.1 lipid-A-disaccharide synthase [Acidocella aminolytica 101 = DSM 11237]GBQ32816.1 lipid-A-disaccharide synthase [Acidocella aminolytica 101 = DSM 11237]SHE51866.1 lipid-A-disaccharide synthase [Acidocella aminolytica 101 = DSM 11237]
MTKIFIIAGEASGDVLGFRLMQALRAKAPEISFSGIGGARMAEAGLTSLFPMQELALMGLAEILPKVLHLKQRLAQTIEAIRTEKPDILLTIDSPGFCLRVLRAIGSSGPKRVHYVAPQVWAWRQERVKHFPGLWDRLLCLLPFEPDFFAPHGLNPVFTGHPVLESGANKGDAARFRATHNLAPNAIPLVLMPGSRVTETKRLLPVFKETLARLQPQIPSLVPVVAAAAGIAEAVIAHTADWPMQPIIVRDVAERYDAFSAAHAGLTKSGTSTLELAMAGVPMAVTYKVNPISAFLGRRLIKVPYVAMINLLGGQALVPELLQEDCRSDRLSETLFDLLNDPPMANTQRAGFATALASLRAPEGMPSDAAAQAILELL